MPLDDVIALLAAALSLPGLRAHPDGSAGFQVGEVVVLLIARPAPEAAFVARTRLGRVQDARAEQQLEQLLAANLFADGIGGPALGLDAQGAVFLTQHFRHDGLAFPAFFAALERFVQHARHCQALLTT